MEPQEAPPANDKTSYLTLLKEGLDKVQRWHEEAMEAAAAARAAASAEEERRRAGGGDSAPSAMESWIEFFIDTVAEIFTRAAKRDVEVVTKSRSLEWKLGTARLELLREVRDRERLGREMGLLKRRMEVCREVLLTRASEEAEGRSADLVALDGRCKRLGEVVIAQENRIAKAQEERSQ